MRVSTDDAARNLRYVWLGPNGVRWPFDATFAAWGLAIGTVVGLIALDWLIVPSVFAKTAFTPVCVIFGALAAKTVMRFVTPDEPVRYHRDTLLAEVRAPRPDDEPRRHVTAIPRGTFTELDPGNATAHIYRVPPKVLSPEETP